MSEKYSTHSRREENVGMPFPQYLIRFFINRLGQSRNLPTRNQHIRRSQGWSPVYCISLTSDTKKNHYHVTHCFSSCAVFAFLRCIYDSLYYGVVALSNIPSKCSERCRVPSLCYSGSALHFPFNNYSAIFPFGCTGECSRCMFLACMRIFRQHDSERRQKQFPQLINKLEESDTEET